MLYFDFNHFFFSFFQSSVMTIELKDGLENVSVTDFFLAEKESDIRK